MTEATALEVNGYKFVTADGIARIGGTNPDDLDFRDLTLEDIGNISEFLATAWLNISGEEYTPVEIGVSYVADEPSPYETARLLGKFESRSERDCE